MLRLSMVGVVQVGGRSFLWRRDSLCRQKLGPRSQQGWTWWKHQRYDSQLTGLIARIDGVRIVDFWPCAWPTCISRCSVLSLPST